MKLCVKYMAQLRTITNRAEEDIELPGGSLQDLLLHLAARHDSVRPHLLSGTGTPVATLLLVVNNAVVPSRDAATVPLQDGDEVMLLPPIAGG